MRICGGTLQLARELFLQFGIEIVFDDRGRVVQMVIREGKMPGHIAFPQAVRPHQDLARFSARGGETIHAGFDRKQTLS